MALGLGVSVGLMGRDFTTKTQIRGVKGGFPRILIKCRRWFSDVISDGFNIVAGLFGSLAVSPYRCCELVIPAGCLGWQFCFNHSGWQLLPDFENAKIGDVCPCRTTTSHPTAKRMTRYSAHPTGLPRLPRLG